MIIVDLIQRTIETGREFDQCPRKSYVQDCCLPIQSINGEENGFMCIGFCKDSRPIDCVKVCMHSDGDDFVGFNVSPREAFILSHLLTSAVGTFVSSEIIGEQMHNEKGYDFEKLKHMVRHEC